MSNTESKERLASSALIAYGGLALPLSMALLPIGLYLPAFYAKEVGLSVGMVGLVLLLARLWDGLSDVIIGMLSDRTTSHFGRRKPWVIVGALLLIVSTWFLCLPPKDVGLVYLGVWAILFYTAYTIVIVPYWSWGAELSSDYEERNRITGFREGGTIVGNLTVATAPLLLLANDAPIRDVLSLIATLIIVLIPIATIPLVVAIKDPQRISVPDFQYVRILNALWQNRPLQLFLAATLFNALSAGVINSVAIFLIDIGLGLPGAFFSLFFIQYSAAIISVPLIIRLANRFGKHRVLAISFIITTIYYLTILILPIGHYYVMAGLIFVAGITFACSFILSPSILADIVDYDSVSTGEERTGIYMALFNLTMKVGMALGLGLAYGVLDIIGFDPAATVHTTQDMVNIRLTACIPSGILLIPAAIIIWKFPITKKVQRKLRQKINANLSSQQNYKDSNATKSSVTQDKVTESSKIQNAALLPDNS